MSETDAPIRSGRLPRTARSAAGREERRFPASRAKRCAPDGRSLGRHPAGAGAHAVPSAMPGAPQPGPQLAPDSGRVMPAVSRRGGDAPVFIPSGGSALQECGRGLCVVDALAQARSRTPKPPAGTTLRGESPTRPLT
ncbi:hypothetical protein [Streptomyces sp. NPDC017890]|uniref:hypothetical protein n=1 Tax=Streptomyces sp. NPDC017890 TaxID=3365015 RepID=UPI00378D3207